MIWELGAGYRAGQPGGQRDLLLQAVKQGLTTPRVTAMEFDGRDVALSFTSLPLARYRVQWTSVLPAGVWQTLADPVPGTGGILRVADRVAAGQSNRFYRILKPP